MRDLTLRSTAPRKALRWMMMAGAFAVASAPAVNPDWLCGKEL